MATTKCVLLPWKMKKNKLATVYLRITQNRKLQYIGLSIAVDPTKWDKDAGRVTSKHPQASKINILLSKKSLKAQEAILGAEIRIDNPQPRTIKNVVKGLSGHDFFEYGDNFVKTYKAKGQIGTYNRFCAVINKIKKYKEDTKFPFDELNMQFLKDYEYYMRHTFKNANNTIHANLKAIMRIVNEAEKDEVITHEQNPFTRYKTKWENTEKIFLTEEELKTFEDLALNIGSMKYHHRNIYVFACYAGGMRISDIITLRWDNFNGDHITLKTQKTGSTVSILLPTKALEIINLYKPEKPKKNEFIFPFIDNSENTKDPQRLHTLISRITAYTNADLSDLAKMAEIDKHVHFHTSRHTWATRALKKGMRIEYVSKLMGHSSIRTTQVYAKIVNADLDNAMKVFEEKPPVVEEVVKEKKK